MGAGVCLVYVTITWLDSQRNMFSQNKYHETKQSYRTKQHRLTTKYNVRHARVNEIIGQRAVI